MTRARLDARQKFPRTHARLPTLHNAGDPLANYSPERVREVFSAAMELPHHARAAFVNQLCSGDTALLGEVRRLVEAYAHIENDEAAPAAFDLTGTLVGQYRILRLLGAGGMGCVYLASRADGTFERNVAVKVVNPVGEAKDATARFPDECRILASLQHPFIASLFDAGRTADGRLYFVMEYVDGLPITSYCQRHRLSIRARVTLFLKVCDAVSRAHRDLIVHRDLKPANVLVDADGVPKLLDFGIAKALTRAGLEASNPTHALLQRATPAYASPEQLQGERAHTGMDVFALGVILHELLTGVRPQPTPPTEATITYRGLYVRPSVVGDARQMPDSGGPDEPKRRGRVDDELDAIVLKAISPDPRQRYQSVDALSHDLLAWSESLPVSAREATAWYRAGRFLRRNRIQLSVAALVILTLMTALLIVLQWWREAGIQQRIARDRFEASRPLAAALLGLDEQLAAMSGATTSRRALVTTLLNHLARLRVHAEGDSRLLLDIAETYRRIGDVQGNPNVSNIGDRPEALVSYAASIAILRTLRDQDPTAAEPRLSLARARAASGDVLKEQSKYAEASAAYLESLALVETLERESSGQVSYQSLAAGVHRAVGDLALAQNIPDRAFEHFEKALAIEEALTHSQGRTAARQRWTALTRLRVAEARAAQGAWSSAREDYAAAITMLRGLEKDASREPRLVRDTAVGLQRLASLISVTDPVTANQQLEAAIALLRDMSARDPDDAGLRHDLLAALVQHADSVRSVDLATATRGYQEARMLARAAAQASRDVQADRDLAIIEQRLNGLLRVVEKTDLKLFSISRGRRQLIEPNTAVPVQARDLAAEATAPRGWSRYLVVFGAEGAGTVFDESELTKRSWRVPLLGPPPAQTILLLAYPRPITIEERDRLLADLAKIAGPRTIDWDSQVLWSSEAEPQILTTATARGQGQRDWIKLVQASLSKLKGAKFVGRTIPIPARAS